MIIKKIIFNGVKDFAADHIFECGQCFRWNKEMVVDAEGTEAGELRYVGVVGDKVCRVNYEKRSEVGTLILEVSGGDEAFWYNYFDLGTDYSEIKKQLVAKEPHIAEACEYGYGIRILRQDIFETLISFIISQNNNIPRIKKCIEAICEKYGESLGEIFGREHYAFPTAETLADASVSDLAAIKLGYRSEYIVESAGQFREQGCPDCYNQVLSYFGIGPKVANCIMLFGLHRCEAFPIDTWVKHIMNDMYGFTEADTKGMKAFADRHFGIYAGYAQQYLFYFYRDRE